MSTVKQPVVPDTVIYVPIPRPGGELVQQPYGTASSVETREFIDSVLPTYAQIIRAVDYVALNAEAERRHAGWVAFETWLCCAVTALPSADDPMEPQP